MTATITALYDALDQPDANVPLILSQLADAYEDAGDSVRARVIRWCWKRGKEPSRDSFAAIAHEWNWWRMGWPVYRDSLPGRAWCLGNVCAWHRTRSAAYRVLADACHEWVERRRGRA